MINQSVCISLMPTSAISCPVVKSVMLVSAFVMPSPDKSLRKSPSCKHLRNGVLSAKSLRDRYDLISRLSFFLTFSFQNKKLTFLKSARFVSLAQLVIRKVSGLVFTQIFISLNFISLPISSTNDLFFVVYRFWINHAIVRDRRHELSGASVRYQSKASSWIGRYSER